MQIVYLNTSKVCGDIIIYNICLPSFVTMDLSERNEYFKNVVVLHSMCVQKISASFAVFRGLY